MVDGREVSETERQFLASWKVTRKAQRKALHHNNKGPQGIYAGSLTTEIHMQL